jgi:hypothetical protein
MTHRLCRLSIGVNRGEVAIIIGWRYRTHCAAAVQDDLYIYLLIYLTTFILLNRNHEAKSIH